MIIVLAAEIVYFRADLLDSFTGFREDPDRSERNAEKETDPFRSGRGREGSAEKTDVTLAEPAKKEEEKIYRTTPLVIKKILGTAEPLTRRGVIDLTNSERAAAGAGGLAENSLLNAAAEKKLDDMFAGQYFAHVSPKGFDAGYFIDRAGYEDIMSGENLAMGDFGSDADLVKGWMGSPGHRENILRPAFKEIGAAVRLGRMEGREQWLAVQIFGVPESACPAPDAALLAETEKMARELKDGEAAMEDLFSKIEGQKKRVAELEEAIVELSGRPGTRRQIAESQNELDALIDEINRGVDQYNQNVAAEKRKFGIYKGKIETYNSQVNAFNACLADLK